MSEGVLAQRVYLPQSPTAAEWLRWATESERPGEVIPWLQETGRIGEYREIAAIVDVPQDPEWHPEGPVDVHTAHVVNAAAEVAAREGLVGHRRTVLIFAALTHDFGKATTTRQRLKNGELRWTSYGHDRESVPRARRFLRRLGMAPEILEHVEPLVLHHMDLWAYKDPTAGARTIRRLAGRVRPSTVRMLGYLIEADHSGRPPLPKHLPEAAARMVALAQQYDVLDGLPPEHWDLP